MEANAKSRNPSRAVLRRRIFLLVLALGLGPAVITLAAATFYGVQAIRSFALDETKARALSQAEVLADNLQAEIDGLSTLASDQEIASALYRLSRGEILNDSARQALRRSLASREPSGGYILMTPERPLGELQLPELRLTPISLPREGLQRGIDQSEAPIFGFDERNSKGEPELWLAARLTGTPALEQNPLWLISHQPLERLLASLAEAGGQSGATIVYSTRTGQLSGSDWPEVERIASELAMPAGFIRLEGPEDAGYVYTRAGSLGNISRPAGLESTLYILKKTDLDAVTAPLFYGVWRLSLFMLVFVAVFGLLGVWLSKKLVRPIVQLRRAFQVLELGNLDHRVELRTGDELEQLGHSMNRMAETLQGTYRTLADKLLELDEKAKQLRLTYDIALSINQSLDLETLLNSIVNHVRQVVETDSVALVLIEEDRAALACVWPSDFWRGPQAQWPLEGSLVQQAIEASELRVFHLANFAGAPETAGLVPSGARNALVLPLGHPEPVGALILADVVREEGFLESEFEILSTLAPTLANAVEHGQLYAAQSRFAEELESKVHQRTEELREAQIQLVQVEKFAAAGEIASNVAHEVNNPLSIIKNHLNLVRGQLMQSDHRRSDNQEIVRDGLRIIEDEIERIARIVHQLRQISSPVQPARVQTNINEEIRTLHRLFRGTFTEKRLRVELHLDSAVPDSVIQVDYLRQILINFLRNSYDAVEVGGEIDIETRSSTPTPDFITITVKDNGAGIDPAHMAKIFDPFFTTKTGGKGTGLGLSVSFGLAVQMGGRIEAASHPGEGTAMNLILPLLYDSGESDMQSKGAVRKEGSRIIIG